MTSAKFYLPRGLSLERDNVTRSDSEEALQKWLRYLTAKVRVHGSLRSIHTSSLSSPVPVCENFILAVITHHIIQISQINPWHLANNGYTSNRIKINTKHELSPHEYMQRHDRNRFQLAILKITLLCPEYLFGEDLMPKCLSFTVC